MKESEVRPELPVVERLRRVAASPRYTRPVDGLTRSVVDVRLLTEAADRLEEVERERDALAEAAFCCSGCGSTRPIAAIQAAGHLSCCPEREMLKASEWRSRSEHNRARAEAAEGALRKIAEGRVNEGAPLPGATDREFARQMLDLQEYRAWFERRVAIEDASPEQRSGALRDVERSLLEIVRDHADEQNGFVPRYDKAHPNNQPRLDAMKARGLVQFTERDPVINITPAGRAALKDSDHG